MEGGGARFEIWREAALCVYGGGAIDTTESLRREGVKLGEPRGAVDVRLESEDVRMP